MRALWMMARAAVRLSVATAFTVYMAVAATAGNWETETVDQSGAGKFSSLRIDTSGNAHVAYVSEDGANSLKYAFWDHGLKRWFVMTVATDASFSSLALDSKQRPHISYAVFCLKKKAKLRNAHWDGAVWPMEALPLTSVTVS